MRRAAVALLCGAALLTACARTEAGNAVATGAATETPQTPSVPSETTAGGSSRPRELVIDGVDPCSLVSVERAATTWGVDREPKPGTLEGTNVIAGSPTCFYNNQAGQAGFLVVTSPQIGVRAFFEQTQAGTRNDIEIEGFPAVEEEPGLSAPERGSGICFVWVDVADGQMLSVQFSQIAASQEKRLPIETLCAKAREVASAAVTTLQEG